MVSQSGRVTETGSSSQRHWMMVEKVCLSDGHASEIRPARAANAATVSGGGRVSQALDRPVNETSEKLGTHQVREVVAHQRGELRIPPPAQERLQQVRRERFIKKQPWCDGWIAVCPREKLCTEQGPQRLV